MINLSSSKIVFLIFLYSIVIIWGIFLNYMYKRNFFSKENYAGKKAFFSYGLISYPCVALGISLLYILNSIDINSFLNYVIIMSLMWIGGAVDDFFGDRGTGGFRGHISYLIKEKKVTTGLIKIIFGIVAGIVAAHLFGGDNILRTICAFFLIPLSANSINLFDLRPGRALFVFFISFFVICLISNFDMYDWGIISVVMVVTVSAYIWDRIGQAMMGDSYSNVLGAFLGILIIMNTPSWFWIVAIILNILLQIFSEKYSISKTIENSKILNFIDKITGNR